MVKRFVPEKVIEEYQKDVKLANVEGRTLTNELHWLSETIWCPLENPPAINAVRVSKDDCICEGTGQIQRLMHPDFWEEVKRTELSIPCKEKRHGSCNQWTCNCKCHTELVFNEE